jgi:hypothetical protein
VSYIEHTIIFLLRFYIILAVVVLVLDSRSRASSATAPSQRPVSIIEGFFIIRGLGVAHDLFDLKKKVCQMPYKQASLQH